MLIPTCPDGAKVRLCSYASAKDESENIADQIAKLVQGVKATLANPDSPSAQLALISASEEFIQVLLS